MLTLTANQLQDIRHHAEESYPDECCGVLIGRFGGDTRLVQSIVPCQNVAIDSRTAYNIDPREVIRAQRAARERGLDIVGFYHSHPDHPAQWSPTDLAEAHWIGCSYVIVAVENGRATETTSFLLTGTLEENKAFSREELILAASD